MSGPHGCGKTTLEKELVKYNPQVIAPELFSRNIKFNTEPEYRQLLKLCGRAIENFEYLELARENPDKMVLANRCIYDVFAYHWVYQKHGWTDEDHFWMYNRLAELFFPGENSTPYAIVLNPPLEVVMRHLESRWKEKEKKWNEEDIEYARLACEAYKPLMGRENVMYIDHEIDLSSGADIKRVNDWLQEIYFSGVSEGLEIKLEELEAIKN